MTGNPSTVSLETAGVLTEEGYRPTAHLILFSLEHVHSVQAVEAGLFLNSAQWLLRWLLLKNSYEKS